MPPPQMQRPPVGSIGPSNAHLIPTIDQWRYVQLMLLCMWFTIYTVVKILILWAICLSKKTTILVSHGGISQKDCHVNVTVTEYCKLLVYLFVCLFLSFFVSFFLLCFACWLHSVIHYMREGLCVYMLLCQVLIIHICAFFGTQHRVLLLLQSSYLSSYRLCDIG